MRSARLLIALALLAWPAAPAAAQETAATRTLFELICSPAAGSIDPALCASGLFQSSQNVVTAQPGNSATDPTLGALVANLLAGNPTAGSIGAVLAGSSLPGLLVPLNSDPCDGLLSDCGTQATDPGSVDQPNAFFSAASPSLNIVLTQQQQALLGCGEFYGTNCEIDGIDILSTEVSVLTQSWVGLGDVLDGSTPQPGTVGFVSAACQRFDNGTPVLLPGCRGPTDPAYDPAVDGGAGLLHPFTGQLFANEFAALSWNALMLAVALSAPADGEPLDPRFFDQSDPLATGRCSFARPQLCAAVQAFPAVPEPGTALALGLGLALLAARRR